MARVSLFLFLLAAHLAGGCLAPGWDNALSKCAAKSEGISVPGLASLSRTAIPGNPIDESLSDAAFGSGVAVRGDLTFGWTLQGPHVVEVFLNEPKAPEASFVLEAGGRPVDRRFVRFPGPDRLSPRSRRAILMVAVVDSGPLVVRSDSEGYLFSAIRWTPVEEFEANRVPALRTRLRHLFEHPYFGTGTGGATRRRNEMDQVASLLRLSRDATAQQEGLLGQLRAAYWVAAENHRPKDLARTSELAQEALLRLPKHPAVRQTISGGCAGTNTPKPMLSGDVCRSAQGVPWTIAVPPDPAGAPLWATAQRRLTRRMEAITRWWVEQRQQPNGELGGGWGDDVEILRHWGPLALGLGSEVATTGIRRMADGLWASGELKDGYSRELSDVEHSSEPSTDTMPLRAALSPNEAAGRERLRVTAKCAANWILPQPDGHWRFRSSWYTCAEADLDPKRAVDVHLNTRAMGPALWSAYFDRDPALVERLAKWAESWRVAMRSTKHGKPFGLIPSALRARDGDYLIDSQRWDTPNVEWDYYQWSGSSQEAITSLFLAMQDLTGNAKWQQAVKDSFSVLKDCVRYKRYCDEMKKSPQVPALPEPGSILERMATWAAESEQKLATNFDMYTSEALWTDRIYYRLPAEYRKHLFGGEAPRGDRFPTFAIIWEPIEGEYARAITKWDERSMELQAYNFEATPITAPVYLWRLKKGDYRCHVYDQTGKLRYTSLFLATRYPQLLRIPIPAHTEVTVKIVPAE